MALAATLFAACGGSPAGAPAGASAQASAPAAVVTQGSLPSNKSDLSTLAGNWVASIEGARLNYATGSYLGGAVTVDGSRIQLVKGDTKMSQGVWVGPTPITNCKVKSCEVRVPQALPYLMSVLDNGTIAMLEIATLKQITAGAGTCAAPVVDGVGVVTTTPDGKKISFLNGIAGGIGAATPGSPCAGASYQIVWTQVLTRAP